VEARYLSDLRAKAEFAASYRILPWRVSTFRHHVSLSPWGDDFALRRTPRTTRRPSPPAFHPTGATEAAYSDGWPRFAAVSADRRWTPRGFLDRRIQSVAVFSAESSPYRHKVGSGDEVAHVRRFPVAKAAPTVDHERSAVHRRDEPADPRERRTTWVSSGKFRAAAP
jgi:hypothetical protein